MSILRGEGEEGWKGEIRVPITTTNTAERTIAAGQEPLAEKAHEMGEHLGMAPAHERQQAVRNLDQLGVAHGIDGAGALRLGQHLNLANNLVPAVLGKNLGDGVDNE